MPVNPVIHTGNSAAILGGFQTGIDLRRSVSAQEELQRRAQQEALDNAFRQQSFDESTRRFDLGFGLDEDRMAIDQAEEARRAADDQRAQMARRAVAPVLRERLRQIVGLGGMGSGMAPGMDGGMGGGAPAMPGPVGGGYQQPTFGQVESNVMGQFGATQTQGVPGITDKVMQAFGTQPGLTRWQQAVLPVIESGDYEALDALMSLTADQAMADALPMLYEGVATGKYPLSAQDPKFRQLWHAMSAYRKSGPMASMAEDLIAESGQQRMNTMMAAAAGIDPMTGQVLGQRGMSQYLLNEQRADLRPQTATQAVMQAAQDNPEAFEQANADLLSGDPARQSRGAAAMAALTGKVVTPKQRTVGLKERILNDPDLFEQHVESIMRRHRWGENKRQDAEDLARGQLTGTVNQDPASIGSRPPTIDKAKESALQLAIDRAEAELKAVENQIVQDGVSTKKRAALREGPTKKLYDAIEAKRQFYEQSSRGAEPAESPVLPAKSAPAAKIVESAQGPISDAEAKELFRMLAKDLGRTPTEAEWRNFLAGTR